MDLFRFLLVRCPLMWFFHICKMHSNFDSLLHHTLRGVQQFCTVGLFMSIWIHCEIYFIRGAPNAVKQKKYCQNLTQNFISTSNPKFSYKKIGAKYEQKNPVGVSLHNLKFEKHIFFWKLVKSVHHVAKTTQYWCVLLKYVSQW